MNKCQCGAKLIPRVIGFSVVRNEGLTPEYINNMHIWKESTLKDKSNVIYICSKGCGMAQ
jgi:hypothetical protein